MTSVEMVDCASLAKGSVVDVETKSRRYRIECRGGNAITISGHPEFCPEPVSAWLHGSIDKEGSLEFGMIGRGMRLMFLVDERHPVTTTRVVRLQVDRPISAPNPSSIH